MTTRTQKPFGADAKRYTRGAFQGRTHFLYYDIETVADPDLPDAIHEDILERVRAKATEKNVDEKVAKKVDEFPLSPLTNRIVCIAFALDDDPPRALYGADERNLLTKFVELVNADVNEVANDTSVAGRIIPVTYNGLAFDHHVLFMKLVQHGLPLPGIPFRVPKYDKGEQHVDLRLILGNFDAYASGTLGQWAVRLGYNGAGLEHAGSDIADLFKEQNWQAIRDKCKTDVELVRFIHKKIARYI